MASPYIVMGCPTTGGGQVITGNSSFLIEGIPIACVGDKATCPKHKTVSTIIAGDPNMLVMGKIAARVNDTLSCGCKLLPKQNLVVRGVTGGASSNQRGGSGSKNNNHFLIPTQFDEQIHLLIDKEDADLYNLIGYKVKVGNEYKEGVLDESGKTERFFTNQAESITELELFLKEKIVYFHELDIEE